MEITDMKNNDKVLIISSSSMADADKAFDNCSYDALLVREIMEYAHSLKEKGIRIFKIQGNVIVHEEGFARAVFESDPDISGIPLDYDWLQKFGFTNNDNMWIKDDYSVIETDGKFFGADKDGHIHQLDHVHQLQNTYQNTTDKKLTIK